MKVDIINENSRIIMITEKDKKLYTMTFYFEQDAIEYCENVLNVYDYTVTRYTPKKREEASA